MNNRGMSRAELQRALAVAQSDIKKLTALTYNLMQLSQRFAKDSTTYAASTTATPRTNRVYPNGSLAGFWVRPASEFPIPSLEAMFQLSVATYDFVVPL